MSIQKLVAISDVHGRYNMIYFSSDEHYFHENITRYTNRPYKNVEEMNKALLENHNKVVKEDDSIYHLGDFCFGSFDNVKRILKQLNGEHHLIIGNHDKLSYYDYIKAGFNTVQKYLFINTSTGPIGLAHDPAICITESKCPWFVGHLHQQFARFGNVINVGVDVRNYSPISITDLGADIEQAKKAIKHNKGVLLNASKELNCESQNEFCN